MLPSRNEGYGPCAFATDPLQHGVIIARADAEIGGNDFPFGFFRQNAGEKAAAFLAAESFFS